MAFLDKHSERPRVVAPKRGFYSEAVANTPLVEEDKDQSLSLCGRLAGQGAASKRPKLAWQVRTELYAPVIARVVTPAPPAPKERRRPAKDLWQVGQDDWANVRESARVTQGSLVLPLWGHPYGPSV